jgi:hypothetical protein
MHGNFLLENVDRDQVNIPVIMIMYQLKKFNINNILELYIQVDRCKDPNETCQVCTFHALNNLA